MLIFVYFLPALAAAAFSSEELSLLKTFFNGPFLENIDKVVEITANVVKDNRLRPSSSEKLQMMEAVNGRKTSPEFQKAAAVFLKKTAAYEAAAIAKGYIRESLRDLQMDNILRKERLAAIVDSVPNTGLVDAYQSYMRQFDEIENRVLELFSQNAEPKDNLFSGLSYTPESLFKTIRTFLSENSLVQSALKPNKYTDVIFINFYHLFRNNAILLTAACTAQDVLQNVTDPASPDQMKNLTSSLRAEYGVFLKAASKVNEWREKQGFVFDALFNEEQFNELQNLNAVPHPSHSNHFAFNKTSESYNMKYYYLTVKFCDGHVDRYHHPSVAMVQRVPRFTCDSWVHRYPLEKASNIRNQVGVGRKFKKAAAAALKGAKNYNELSAAKLIYDFITQQEKMGLIAIVTTRNPGSIVDDVYSSPGGYKVVLDFDIIQQAYTEKNFVRLQVVGYFIASENNTKEC